MRKNRNKWLLLLLVFVMSVTMAGCGKKTEVDVPEGDVYVPTFAEINPEMEWIENVFTDEDKVYFMGSRYEYDEETNTGNSFVVMSVYDMNTKEMTKKEMRMDENAYINQMTKLNDGFAGIETSYNEIYDENGEWLDSENEYRIVYYDNELNETGSADLSEIAAVIEEQNGWFDMENVLFSDDGKIYFTSDCNIYCMNKEGDVQFKIELATWIDRLVMTADGRIVAFYYDENYSSVVGVLDAEKKEMGPALENMPSYNSGVYAAEGGKLYMNSTTSLYLYDIDTATSEEILNWVDCDINTSSMVGFTTLPDEKFMVLCNTYDYSGERTSVTVEMATLEKVPAKDVKQKTQISLAMFYVDYDIKERIIKFNRSSQDYRITLKTYVNDDWSNYEEADTQFRTDIGTGNAADIIVSNSGSIDLMSLSSKKIFADLYELMENDPEVNKESFIPSILKALEVDGKLYSICSSFSVATIVGATSDVGDDCSWTFDEMMALLDKYPDAQLFQYTTKDFCMQTFLRYGMDAFYDTATGDCHFNSAEFIKLLELANKFPKEYEYEYTSLPSQLRNKEVLLNEVSLWGWDEFMLYEGLYGEPVTYVGYPTTGGSGNVANVNNCIAISAKSKNKEAAWNFVKSMVNYDAQSDGYYSSFPTNLKAFDEMMAKATDKDNGTYSWMYDDVEITMGALTQAQADELREIINSITSVASYDEQLYNIISEEAQAYFEGQKTAEDVANIIQSRAQNYIDENR